MIHMHPLTIRDKVWVDQIVSAEDSRCSDYSFVSVYLWDAEPSLAGKCGERLALLCQRKQGHFFLFPIGNGPLNEAILEMRGEAERRGIPFILFGLTEEQKERLESAFPRCFAYEEAPEYFDYIYSLDKLTSLPGRKLHGKRNLVHQFEREYPDWKLVELSKEHLPTCWNMQCRWMEGRGADEAAQAEQQAFSKTIDHYEELGLEGVSIYVDGDMVAFAIGETIALDTYLIHFEKAASDVVGAYAMINREYARWIGSKHPEIKYINREDDLGYDNLRKAKLSYCPEVLLKKSYATWVGNDS